MPFSFFHRCLQSVQEKVRGPKSRMFLGCNRALVGGCNWDDEVVSCSDDILDEGGEGGEADRIHNTNGERRKGERKRENPG